MDKQDNLIGTHPTIPNVFGKWLDSNNLPSTNTKCHRSLTVSETSNESELIEWLSNKVIEYHFKESQVTRLKTKYSSLGFEEYADYLEQKKMTPAFDNTRKGNLTEILLCEYVINSKNKELIKVFRFRHSTNIEQSMKGDDVLLVDYLEELDDIQIYLGEAKFRGTPTSQGVGSISDSLTKDKIPLSFTFLVEKLYEVSATQDIAEKLDKFIIKKIKQQEKIIYTGLLLSNENTSNIVERNLNNDNPNLIFISLGISEPVDFVNKVFDVVEQKLINPATI